MAESLYISDKDVISLDLYSSGENSEDYLSRWSCGFGDCFC